MTKSIPRDENGVVIRNATGGIDGFIWNGMGWVEAPEDHPAPIIKDTRTFARFKHSNAEATSAGGYTITHRFQYQDEDECNDGQYEESVQVEYWDAIPGVVASMLNHPDAGGFTLSISVTANDA